MLAVCRNGFRCPLYVFSRVRISYVSSCGEFQLIVVFFVADGTNRHGYLGVRAHLTYDGVIVN
jgi:hypothetical protein